MVVEVRRSTAHPMSEAINLHDTIDQGNFEIKESDPQAAAQDLLALARAGSACVRGTVPFSLVLVLRACARYGTVICMPKDDMPVVVCQQKKTVPCDALTRWGSHKSPN